MLEVIILSIVQGVTEFLPISSSAHLILVSKYFDFSNGNLTLDLSLHLGSLLATITYFRKDIFNFMKNRNMLLKILISSIPTMIFGFLLIKYSLIDVDMFKTVILDSTYYEEYYGLLTEHLTRIVDSNFMITYLMNLNNEINNIYNIGEI